MQLYFLLIILPRLVKLCYCLKNNITFEGIVLDKIENGNLENEFRNKRYEFFERILRKYNLNEVKAISNHGEFRGEFFEITFPNDNPNCINNAGTCKCKVLKDLKEKYNKIVYIGDGASDFCVAGRADVLYAKKRLLDYCREKNINCIPYETFEDIGGYFENI